MHMIANVKYNVQTLSPNKIKSSFKNKLVDSVPSVNGYITMNRVPVAKTGRRSNPNENGTETSICTILYSPNNLTKTIMYHVFDVFVSN